MTFAETITALVERMARVAAALAILFACAVMVHQHTHQADRAPYVAVDDALGNVSASMVALGRNGFPASPIQGAAGSADPRRNQVQLNYGYAPFLIGAALDWMFGTSYQALRAIHVVGLIATIAVAWVAFRKHTPLAPLLYASVVAVILWPTQWPMFRPDMGVAVSALIAVACAMAALRGNGLWAWIGTGFFAATTFASHQIAWVMIPWAGVIWAIAVAMTEPGRRLTDITIGPLIAVTAAGLAGLMAYGYGIGWRIGDLTAMWSGYSNFVSGAEKPSYGSVLAKHFTSAWASVPSRWVFTVYVAIAAGCCGGIWLAWRRSDALRPYLATMLPSALVAMLYLGSLGAYPNWHSGYTLLVQLATVWAAVASLAALGLLIPQASVERLRLWFALAVLTGAGLLAVNAKRSAEAGTIWSAYAPSYVSFSDYEARVLADVPKGATAVGNIIFGLKSGSRHQLIQTGDAVALLDRLGPLSRRPMLPDHLLLNSEIFDSLRLLVHRNESLRARVLRQGGGLVGPLGPFNQPGVSYGETGIVFAEPYGETRIMTRDDSGRPAVAIYDARTATWATRTEPVDLPQVTPHEVSLELERGGERTGAAAGLALNVAPGTYIAEVDMSSRGGGIAIVTGSTRPLVALDPGQVNVAGTSSVALAFAGNSTIHVIVRAPGGSGYIGYFGAPLSGPLALKRLQRFMPPPDTSAALELPPLADWRVQSPGFDLALSGEGRTASFRQQGLPAGYLLASPAIDVPAGAVVTIGFNIEAIDGQVGLGVINSKGAWIVPPTSDGRLTIETGAHTSVRLVLTNLEGRTKLAPARFAFRLDTASVRKVFGHRRLYVDELARCFTPPGTGATLDACK